MGKQGKRKAAPVTEASSRKARRKEQRQMKKQRRARSASFDSAGGRRRSESGDSWTQMSKKSGNKAKTNSGGESNKTKKKRSSSVDKQQSFDAGDPYAHLDPAVAAQLRADDAEIAEMERMLGVGGGGAKTAEERKRLNKEYEKLEGYGSDFGEFLYDLDGLAERLGGGEDGSEHRNGDDHSEGSAASDVDMREQYESEEDEVVEKSAEKKKDKSSKKDKKKSKSKEAASSSSSDPYAHMDDETAAALRAEDAEIAALEDKLDWEEGTEETEQGVCERGV